MLFCKKDPENTGPQDFGGFSILQYVRVFRVRFLQKYRCVPKIGFPADIAHQFCVQFLQKYRCVPKIGFSAVIFMDISIFLLFSSEVSLCT